MLLTTSCRSNDLAPNTARQIGLSGFVPPLSTKESFPLTYNRIPDFSNLVDFLTKESPISRIWSIFLQKKPFSKDSFVRQRKKGFFCKEGAQNHAPAPCQEYINQQLFLYYIFLIMPIIRSCHHNIMPTSDIRHVDGWTIRVLLHVLRVLRATRSSAMSHTCHVAMY